MEEHVNRKYEIVQDDSFYSYNRCYTYYRIRALRDFGWIKKGQLGGYIGPGATLSHEGNCWLADEAMIANGTSVEGNAWVGGYADIRTGCTIKDNAFVSGFANIIGATTVISDSAVVTGYTQVDKSYVGGHAHIEGISRLTDARIDSGFFDRHRIIRDEIELMEGQFSRCRPVPRKSTRPVLPRLTFDGAW